MDTTPRTATKGQLAYRAIRHQAAKQAGEALIPIGEAVEVDFAVWLEVVAQ